MKTLFLLVKILIAVTVLALIFGCGATKELTEIKPLIIKPAVIHDTVNVQLASDTVIIGADVVKNDTITLVKYFPKLQKFYIQAKPDSIILFDTVRSVITNEVKTPLLSKFGIFAIGAIIASLLFVLQPWKYLR